MHGNTPIRIVFVDTGNTGRSVTAAALARALITRDRRDARVSSRAVTVNPGHLHPEAHFVTLLRPRGIDTAAHVATAFGPSDAHETDLILTMTTAHKAWVLARFPDTRGKVFTLSDYATGVAADVPDAFGEPMAFYEAVLLQLDRLVEIAIAKAAP